MSLTFFIFYSSCVFVITISKGMYLRDQHSPQNWADIPAYQWLQTPCAAPVLEFPVDAEKRRGGAEWGRWRASARRVLFPGPAQNRKDPVLLLDCRDSTFS